MLLDTYIGGKLETYHIGGIDQYKVAACTTDATSEVRVDISSTCIRRRNLITNTFTSANISYNTGKKPVLRMKLGPFMDVYRSGILATADIPKLRVYISSIWMYRRGSCTITSYTTNISQNHKLQMCPDDVFVGTAVTE